MKIEKAVPFGTAFLLVHSYNCGKCSSTLVSRLILVDMPPMSVDTHIEPSAISDEPLALAGAGLSLAGPRDFFQLMKPRVMSLVIFTAIIGLLVAPGTLPILNSVIAIFCIAVGAGASGALNMWYDADIDAQMTRTKKRPVRAG